MLEKQRVLDANTAFDAAFRSLDFGAMDALWAKRGKVSVCHPGQPGIDTRDAVMASWCKILVPGPTAQVAVFNPTAIVTAKSAFVICREEIGGTHLIATNVFVLEDGMWRITQHQASRLLARTARTTRWKNGYR